MFAWVHDDANLESEVVLAMPSENPHKCSRKVRIRIRELPMADGVHASTGGLLWGASVALAQEIFCRPELVKRKRVLEVGAGCGLAGIAAAMFARETCITDCDQDVLKNAAHNLSRNAPQWQPSACDEQRSATTYWLDWNDVLKHGAPERFEVIMASDVIYGHWGEDVARAMDMMLEPQEGYVLLVSSLERRVSCGEFTALLQKTGYTVMEYNLGPLVSKMPLRQDGINGSNSFIMYQCRRQKREHWHLALSRSPPRPEVQEAEATLQPALQTFEPEEEPKTEAEAEPEPAVLPTSRTSKSKVKKNMWRVVGGKMSRGIVVRDCSSLKDGKELGRLSYNAKVRELKQTSCRLQYRLVRGRKSDPTTGWVSLRCEAGPLLELIEPGDVQQSLQSIVTPSRET